MGYANKIYWILAIATYSLYFLAFVGVYKSKEQLDLLNFYYRFFIGIMLVYIFNPLSSRKILTKFHTGLAFSGGLNILLLLGIETIRDKLNPLSTFLS